MNFTPFIAVVEDVDDPTRTGRVRCRAFEFHSQDHDQIPTDSLPWAIVALSPSSASLQGISHTHSLIVGSWVIGFFTDSPRNQEMMIFASIPSASAFADNPQIDYHELTRGTDSKRPEFTSSISEFTNDYDPEYPLNRVDHSRSGHFTEIDDTPNASRIRVQHNSGTFTEVVNDGSRQSYVVSDALTVIEGTGEIHVKGNVKVVVDGNVDMTVNGTTLLTCSSSKIDGDVQITGDLRVDKSVSVAKDVVTDKGISHNNHVHPITTGSSAGFTSKPK